MNKFASAPEQSKNNDNLRWLLGFLSLATSAGLFGCAEIQYGPAEVTRLHVGTTREEVPRKSGLSTKVELQNTELRVEVARVCDVKEKLRYRETSVRTLQNRSASLDWVALGGGVVLAGAGAITLADANNVSPSDGTHQTYNSVGPSNAKAIGYSLTAAGVALMIIPLVDAIRSQGSTSETGEKLEQGPIVQDGIACQSSPGANARVSLSIGSGTSNLVGNTDAKGRFRMSLETWLPQHLRWGDDRVRVFVDDEKVSEQSVVPLLLVREAAAWESLPRSQCSSPKQSTDCGIIVTFLEQYKGGPHSGAANALLSSQTSVLQRLKDAETWAQINPNDCASKKTESPKELDSMCEQLRAYLNEFGDGTHASEAKIALEKGEKRYGVWMKKIRDKEEREQREQEAKEARQQREQEAREARQQREQEAGERRAQRAQKAKEREACQSVCLMGCSNHLHEDSCLASCLVTQCEQQGGN